MNTPDTLRNKFCDNNEFPIWYYKELEEISIAQVISDLITSSFVVEIDDSKHEITFAKNRKREIGQCIRYDDIKNSNLCSFEVVREGFKKGKWFRITDKDTTEEFKAAYIERKEEHSRKEHLKTMRKILINCIKSHNNLPKEQKENFIKSVENASPEEIDRLFGFLMDKYKE